MINIITLQRNGHAGTQYFISAGDYDFKDLVKQFLNRNSMYKLVAMDYRCEFAVFHDGHDSYWTGHLTHIQVSEEITLRP